MDMDISKVAKVLFCISQNKSDEDIIKMMKIGNIKEDDNDTNPFGNWAYSTSRGSNER